MVSQNSSVVLNDLISVKEAVECSGYSLQHMGHILPTGKLAGLKLGQVWLIQMESFEAYLANAENSKDYVRTNGIPCVIEKGVEQSQIRILNKWE
jgi:hypothetical protein